MIQDRKLIGCSNINGLPLLLIFGIVTGMYANINNLHTISTAICFTILVSSFCVNNLNSAIVVLFLLFNTKTLTLSGISISTLITVVIVVRQWLLNKIKPKRLDMIYGLIFLFMEMIWWAAGITENMGSLIKFWFLLIYFKQTFLNIGSPSSYNDTLKYILVGFITIVGSSLMFNKEALMSTRFALTKDIGINMTGFFCGMVFSYAYINIANNFLKTREMFLSVFSMLLALFIGVLTASRTFFFMCASLLVMTPFFYTRKIKMLLKKGIAIILMICLGYVVVENNAYLNDEISYFANRIIEPRNNDISNNRFKYWTIYGEVIFANERNFLLGFNTNDYAIDFMAHNAYIETFSSYGLVGSSFILMFFLYEIKEIKNHARKNSVKVNSHESNRLYLLPAILVLISGVATHSLMALPKSMFILHSLSLYYINKYRY